MPAQPHPPIPGDLARELAPIIDRIIREAPVELQAALRQMAPRIVRAAYAAVRRGSVGGESFDEAARGG